MDNTIRAFIAIPLPPEVKAALGQHSDRLAATVSSGAVRWVKPGRIHLTLRFLGDAAVDMLPAISTALDKATAAVPPFTLATGPTGCFPNCRRPRVIWIGLQAAEDELQQLKGHIDLALEPLGWPREEKPFRPHLTLGRVKDSRALRDVAWETAVPSATLPVTAVHLIQSELRPEGPQYTVLHSSLLNAG